MSPNQVWTQAPILSKVDRKTEMQNEWIHVDSHCIPSGFRSDAVGLIPSQCSALASQYFLEAENSMPVQGPVHKAWQDTGSKTCNVMGIRYSVFGCFR